MPPRRVGPAPRRAGQYRAVPAVRGHSNRRHGDAFDLAGLPLPAPGTGATTWGHAHCQCGAVSPLLPSGRERKLWHTRHREEIAGVPWMSDTPIDWPAEFGTAEDLAGLAWTERLPGFWQAPYTQGRMAVAAVTPTDRQWYAAVIASDTLTSAHMVASLSYNMHDALAERLRAKGRTVGCAAEGCAYLWPCPVREASAFLGAKNGGELHTPIGQEKTDG